MNAGQYEGLMGRLGEILDRMPVRDIPDAPEPQRPAQPATQAVFDRDDTMGRQAASLALYTLLTVLDGWIEGAQENHVALEHRGRENRGEECWRSFAPSDIRRMVNDAARELGLSEFPEPAKGREDVEL